MKHKTILNLLIFLLASSPFNSIMAQKELPSLSINNISFLKSYIAEFYKPDEKFIAAACINSVIYVKFKVNKNDKIESVDVSQDGPAEIKEALKKAVWATSEHWKSTEEEKKEMEGKSFILPFVFNYQSGCSSGIILPPNDPQLKVYAEKQKNLNIEIHNSVSNMLKFESGSSGSINCVLISPMIVGSIN